MTDKTLAELHAIATAKPETNIDRLMRDRANSEIHRRFVIWWQVHGKRQTYDVARRRFLQENGVQL